MITLLSFVLLIGLQLLDVFTTKRILAAGGRELNPIVAFLMTRGGPNFWVVAKLLVAWTPVYVLWRSDNPLFFWVVCSVNVVMAIFVFRNFRVLKALN